MNPKRSDYLLSTKAVRDRSAQIFAMTLAGQGHFEYHPENWEKLIDFVVATIHEKYPSLEIPFHSRLGHFRPGGIDRLTWPELGLSALKPWEKLAVLVDLIIPSVLLDAGAGTTWTFKESRTGQMHSRSEGLGVASLHMFLNKNFSSQQKISSDANGLIGVTEKDIELGFQVNSENPLIGVPGRVQLLNSLGNAILNAPAIFKNQRPSDLVEQFTDETTADAVKALTAVLKYLGPIWPSRLTFEDVPLGDTWSHPGLGPTGSFESLVPFHKLSQWLTYSLLDACQLCGYRVLNVDQLTGLPEYRNGGLFVDLGLITPKDSKFLDLGVTPEMTFTIEWRALTVHFLDQVAVRVRKKMNLNAENFPLAKVLEGGTWWAGRKIAAQKRKDAGSPIRVILDGTVF